MRSGRPLRFLRRTLKAIVLGRRAGIRRRIFRRVMRGCGANDDQVVQPQAVPAEPTDGWRDLGPAEELHPGTIAEYFAGEQALAVANVDGQLHAIPNTCAHAGGPLGDGTLEGCVVACPWHGWTFDVTDGHCTLDPSIVLEPVPVRVQDGRIQVRVD